jgi:hypothetical protein
MVGTPAFSAGVNEKRVKLVLGAYGSYSSEDYLQETGRAGRDDSPAAAEAVAFITRIFSPKVFDPTAPLEKCQRLHSVLAGNDGSIVKAFHEYNDGLPTRRCNEGVDRRPTGCWVCDGTTLSVLFDGLTVP